MARPHRDGPADAGPDLLPLRAAEPGVSLQALLDRLVTAALETHRSSGHPAVSISVDAAVHVPAGDAAGLREIIEPLLVAACEAASAAPRRRREVVVTAVETPTALEIEVADSGGCRSADGEAVSSRLASLARRIGGQLGRCDCPDGGTAVTLQLPRRRAGSLAA